MKMTDFVFSNPPKYQVTFQEEKYPNNGAEMRMTEKAICTYCSEFCTYCSEFNAAMRQSEIQYQVPVLT